MIARPPRPPLHETTTTMAVAPLTAARACEDLCRSLRPPAAALRPGGAPDPSLAPPDGVHAVAVVLRSLHDRLAEAPLPGAGRTADRWAILAAAGTGDLSLARLLEGHLDALAILSEAGVPAPEGMLGVWAADPPDGAVLAAWVEGGWQLTGTKRFCSGVEVLDGALVTAHATDGYRLFHVDAAHWTVAGTWAAPGMVGSGTLDAVLASAPATPVGQPGYYLDRPGFDIGGIGVAAVWLGAAEGCRRSLLAGMPGTADATALAHLGAVDAAVTAGRALLEVAADQVDADPTGDHARLAQRVRAVAVGTALMALERTDRALGTRVTVADPVHARRVADLPVYASQHHGDRDLASLGRRILAMRDA